MDPPPPPEIINKEKSMRWKKYEIIENEDVTYNSWYIEKNIRINIISGYLKQGYHMLGKQLKTIILGQNL